MDAQRKYSFEKIPGVGKSQQEAYLVSALRPSQSGTEGIQFSILADMVPVVVLFFTLLVGIYYLFG